MKWQLTLIAVFALSMVAQRADAQCCARCGKDDGCCKKTTCKIVCEMKKVKDTFYCCECEDFCLPGPSCDCLGGCSGSKGCKSCGGSGCNSCCEKPAKPAYCSWFKKKNLIKYECEKEVPVYKCVVVPLCSCCRTCVEKEGGVMSEPTKIEAAPAPAPAPASAQYRQDMRSDLSPLLIP